MTRKDYIALAEALNHSKPIPGAYEVTENEDKMMLAQWREDVRAIAVALKADNSRFDHARFLVAVGVEV